MSVPPDQMGAPPPGGAPGGEPSPGAAPTLTPQDNKGEQASADAGMEIALRLIEHVLVAHGSGTEKGKAAMKMLETGRKAFGKGEDRDNEIMPAELKSALMAPSAGGGGGAPEGPPEEAQAA